MPFPSKNPKHLEARERIDEWHPSLNNQTVYGRILRGWDVDKAIKTKMGSNQGGRKENSPWNTWTINPRK